MAAQDAACQKALEQLLKLLGAVAAAATSACQAAMTAITQELEHFAQKQAGITAVNALVV